LDYTDVTTGKRIVLNGPNGDPLRLKFDKSRRTLRYPKANKKMLSMLRDHPQCYGSKNAYTTESEGKTFYPDALFKEIKENEDAKISVDASKTRFDAMNLVFKVIEDEDKAEDLAVVLGVSGSGEISHNKLLLYAEKNPEELIRTVKSPDFKARALARKGLNLDVLQKKGIIYCIGDVEYGIEFDDIVKSIVEDRDRMELVKSKLGTIK